MERLFNPKCMIFLFIFAIVLGFVLTTKVWQLQEQGVELAKATSELQHMRAQVSGNFSAREKRCEAIFHSTDAGDSTKLRDAMQCAREIYYGMQWEREQLKSHPGLARCIDAPSRPTGMFR